MVALYIFFTLKRRFSLHFPSLLHFNMAAPMMLSRRVFLRYCCKVLKANKISFRKYHGTRKTIREVFEHDITAGNNSLFSEGWVKSLKKQKHCTFFHINDGTSGQHLQVIADPCLCSSDLGYGCSVRVEGEIVESPARGQSIELRATNVQVIGTCDAGAYPLHFKQKPNINFVRTVPHLRPRTEHNYKMLRVRNAASMAVHNFFQNNDFMFVHTPIITSSNCEGAVEMFSLQTNPEANITEHDTDEGDKRIEVPVSEEHANSFFHRPVYMTVSGQLHLEIMTGSCRKVYNFGPTFRAEPSTGMHHLAEFYMIEAELAFTENLESILQVMEHLVKDVTRDVLSKHSEEYEYFKKQASADHESVLRNLMDKEFIRMTYTDAIKLLQKENGEYQKQLKWGDDLKKEHEKFLVNILGNTPVFVTDFPKEMKPFYCRQNEDNRTVAAVDLLVPGVGELFGGSLREERFDVLKLVLDKLNFTHDYDWYLDLRRYGSVPHGGFGMGFERYLQCLLGIQNIKDTIPFPRWLHNCLL